MRSPLSFDLRHPLRRCGCGRKERARRRGKGGVFSATLFAKAQGEALAAGWGDENGHGVPGRRSRGLARPLSGPCGMEPVTMFRPGARGRNRQAQPGGPAWARPAGCPKRVPYALGAPPAGGPGWMGDGDRKASVARPKDARGVHDAPCRRGKPACADGILARRRRPPQWARYPER